MLCCFRNIIFSSKSTRALCKRKKKEIKRREREGGGKGWREKRE